MFNEFEDTFNVSLKNINYEQWFKLAYLTRGKGGDMWCCNNLEDFKEFIIGTLTKWYKDKSDPNEEFNNLDWAEETKKSIQSILIKGNINENKDKRTKPKCN